MRKWLFTVGCLVFAGLQAQVIQPVDDGPVHEAFLTEVSDGLILDAILTEPPKPIMEKEPEQKDSRAEWVKGYWAWSAERSDFIWVSGVWRRPPPGHEWISGEWAKLPEGWVWIRGFWSQLEEDDLDYIDHAPPDSKDENPGDPPSDESFWMAGYWEHQGGDDFEWVMGKWETIDPNWVFVPAHYTWRQDGWVFVPAYWDWPLEEAGEAYSNVFIAPASRDGVEYTPSVVVEARVLLRRLVVYYPNYLYCYSHHYHYHWHWWAGWWGTPPWWGWHSWWGFGWQAHWGVWWWWGHPGFPAPFWLNVVLAAQIWPPGAQLLGLMKNAHAPFVITPRGLVPAKKIRDAIGGKRPIMPADPARQREIIKGVEPKVPGGEQFRPAGRRKQPGDRFDPKPPRVGDLPQARPGGRQQRVPRIPDGKRPQRIRPERPQVRPVPESKRPERPQRPDRVVTPPRPEVRPRPVPVYPDAQPRPRPRPRPRPEMQPQPQPRPRPRPRPAPETRPRPRPVPETRPHGPSQTPSPRPSPGPSEITPSRPRSPRQVTPQPRYPRQPQPRQFEPRRVQPQPPAQTDYPRQPQPRNYKPRQVRPQPPRNTQYPRQTQPRNYQPRRVQPSQTQPRRTQPRQMRPTPNQRGNTRPNGPQRNQVY